MSIMQIQPPYARRSTLASAHDDTRPSAPAAGDKRLAWEPRTAANGNAAKGSRRDYFENLYRTSRDPWNCEGSYYERAKRGTMLAALPEKHYGDVLELGCSNGALSVDLAGRCDRLLAVDISETALDYARQRDYPRGNVTFLSAELPREWPQGDYDLIIISDLLYFLSRTEIRQLARLAAGSLKPSGECVLVDWRGETGLPLSGAEASACFVEALGVQGRFMQVINEKHDGYVLEIYKAAKPLY